MTTEWPELAAKWLRWRDQDSITLRLSDPFGRAIVGIAAAAPPLVFDSPQLSQGVRPRHPCQDGRALRVSQS